MVRQVSLSNQQFFLEKYGAGAESPLSEGIVWFGTKAHPFCRVTATNVSQLSPKRKLLSMQDDACVCRVSSLWRRDEVAKCQEELW